MSVNDIKLLTTGFRCGTYCTVKSYAESFANHAAQLYEQMTPEDKELISFMQEQK